MKFKFWFEVRERPFGAVDNDVNYFHDGASSESDSEDGEIQTDHCEICGHHALSRDPYVYMHCCSRYYHRHCLHQWFRLLPLCPHCKRLLEPQTILGTYSIQEMMYYHFIHSGFAFFAGIVTSVLTVAPFLLSCAIMWSVVFIKGSPLMWAVDWSNLIRMPFDMVFSLWALIFEAFAGIFDDFVAGGEFSRWIVSSFAFLVAQYVKNVAVMKAFEIHSRRLFHATSPRDRRLLKKKCIQKYNICAGFSHYLNLKRKLN